MGKCLNFVLVLSDWLMVRELDIGFKFLKKIIVFRFVGQKDAGGGILALLIFLQDKFRKKKGF